MASPTSAPTSYRELAAVLEALPLLVREARRARGLSVRAAGRQVGVSFATISRVEASGIPAVPVALALLRWLDRGEGQ